MAIYYSVCCLLAFMTFAATRSGLLKWTSVLMAFSFGVVVARYTIWEHFGGVSLLNTIIAGVIFIVAITKHQGLPRSEKPLFILFTTMIIVKILFGILHLSGATEMSLLVLVTTVMTGLWIIYKRFTGKSLKGQMDVIEVAGLFACFIAPTFIPLLQSLLR